MSHAFKDQIDNSSQVFINLYKLLSMFSKWKTISYKDGNITDQDLRDLSLICKLINVSRMQDRIIGETNKFININIIIIIIVKQTNRPGQANCLCNQRFVFLFYLKKL